MGPTRFELVTSSLSERRHSYLTPRQTEHLWVMPPTLALQLALQTQRPWHRAVRRAPPGPKSAMRPAQVLETQGLRMRAHAIALLIVLAMRASATTHAVGHRRHLRSLQRYPRSPSYRCRTKKRPTRCGGCWRRETWRSEPGHGSRSSYLPAEHPGRYGAGSPLEIRRRTGRLGSR